MTPLQINILLHYYACANDFRDGDLDAPAVKETIREFEVGHLLSANIARVMADIPGPLWQITPRGRAYVEVLQSVPLPEWIPGRWDTGWLRPYTRQHEVDQEHDDASP